MVFVSENKTQAGVSTSYRYTPEQQGALVSNVFLTGGNMQYPGMKARVEKELLAMRPFQSHFKVVQTYPVYHDALESPALTCSLH